MSKELIRGIFMLMVSIIIMGGILGFVYYLDNAPTHIEKVNCFDKFGNLIGGLTCDDEVYDNGLLEKYQGFIMFIIFPMMISAFIFILGIIIIINSLSRENGNK